MLALVYVCYFNSNSVQAHKLNFNERKLSHFNYQQCKRLFEFLPVILMQIQLQFNFFGGVAVSI